MLNLTKRVNKLLERTTSLECKNVCKEVLEMYNNVPEDQLSQALVEKLKDIKDADKFVSSFIQSTEKSMKIKDLGISKAISKIRESQTYHYPALRYSLDKFERAKINEGTLDYLIAEEFLNALRDFTWDANVKEALDSVREVYEADKELVQISKAVFEFRKAKGNFLFEKVCETLEDHFESLTEASRSAAIEELSKFSYNSTAKSLYETLKRIQSSSKKNSLNIIAENNNCEVSQAYSTIFVENGNEYFTVKGDVYKKSSNLVEKVGPEEFSSLSENIRRSYEILNSPHFFVKEGKASFYLGRNKIEISESENSTKVLFNGKQVPSSEIAKNLLSTGMIRLEEAKAASDIQFVNDTFSNFYELDFAKVISSKIYEGSYVTLMKVDENIYLNKVNTSMRTNEFFSGINATQARNLVLEFLGYDIKESLSEYIERDEAEMNAIREQQSEIIKNITILEGQISKIENSKKDQFFASQPQVKALEEMLSQELAALKDQYSTLNLKLRKFEAKTSDAGVELGEDVKIVETGEIATVSAIDSNTKKVTVVSSDGKTQEYPINKIASVKEEEDKALSRNEDKGKKESEEEPTGKVEEAEGTLNAGGNEVPVENPNKDKFPAQDPGKEPAKVEDEEEAEYVHGTVDPDQHGSCAGKEVEVLASDYASKGAEDLIEVKCAGETYFIEKKHLKVSTSESDDSMTIDFDAAPPKKDGDDKKEEPKKEEPKKEDSEEAPEKKEDSEEKPEKKEDSEEDSKKEKKPSIEELQSKLAKALQDLESIRDDMKDTFTSNETISTTISSLRGLTDAMKKDSHSIQESAK